MKNHYGKVNDIFASKYNTMKKLLLGSIIMICFSVSIILFQISCKKEANAQSGGNSATNYVLKPATTSTLGGVIVGNGLSVSSDGTLSVNNNGTNNGGSSQLNLILYFKNNGTEELWTANIDGTNQTKVPIVLPSGLHLGGVAHLTPDDKKIIFSVGIDNVSDWTYMYSCNIDGSSVTKIIDGSQNIKLELQDVY